VKNLIKLLEIPLERLLDCNYNIKHLYIDEFNKYSLVFFVNLKLKIIYSKFNNLLKP
jgi:hypothetical protein